LVRWSDCLFKFFSSAKRPAWSNWVEFSQKSGHG
jgi:hypothetical protein